MISALPSSDAGPASGLPGLVLRAALLREESRGAHVRTDRPWEDPAWAGREVVASLGSEGRPAVVVRARALVAAAS